MLLSDINWRDIQASDTTKPAKKQRLIRNAPMTIVIQARLLMEQLASPNDAQGREACQRGRISLGVGAGRMAATPFLAARARSPLHETNEPQDVEPSLTRPRETSR